MANARYEKASRLLAEAGLHWVNDTIKAILIDTSAYTVNLSTHEFLSDVAGGAIVGSAVTLSSKTNTLGVLDAADVSFTGLSSAPTIEALIIYKDTGSSSTSPLLYYIDTATGLPTASGATQVDVAWDNGSNKIAKI